jgi:Tfp pilus assembly protein PilF
MLRWTLLLCCHLLAACAAVPPPAEEGLFHDAAFAPPSQAIDAKAVFALSPAMQHLLDTTPVAKTLLGDPRRELLDTLFGQRKLLIEYDSTLTRNASEAFAARSGNCLSLVIMTAAFAKAVGQPVQYREVLVDEAWSRNGDLYFASGHVHLALGWPAARPHSQHETPGALVVDFLPSDELRGLRTRPIEENTIVAMFMNNRAAEALARGAIADAYWWAREAVRQDRTFLTAYNTLAVIYTRQGQPRWALPVFKELLARDPGNTKVMGNLVAALRAEGRDEEAKTWAVRLAAIEPYPPFHYFNAGQIAMQAHDWRSARDLFRKELLRQGYNPELHFWLAQANYNLGNLREADKHLDLARQSSTTPQDAALYAAKLGWLRAHGLPQ